MSRKAAGVSMPENPGKGGACSLGFDLWFWVWASAMGVILWRGTLDATLGPAPFLRWLRFIRHVRLGSSCRPLVFPHDPYIVTILMQCNRKYCVAQKWHTVPARVACPSCFSTVLSKAVPTLRRQKRPCVARAQTQASRGFDVGDRPLG